MNQKPIDRRIQRTRKLLLDALLALILEKGFEEVTVQDIIDRANVGRSTFYAHFQDKEDLLLSGFESLRVEFEQHLSSQPVQQSDPWNLSLTMFQHAQGQRQLYKALTGKQGGSAALEHIQKYLSMFLARHFKQLLGANARNFPPEVLTRHVVGAFISLLVWWLDTDSSYSARQMNDFYRQLVEPGIQSILGGA